MVSITPKTQTFTNGTANDAGPLDSELTNLFNNDQTLANSINNDVALKAGVNTFSSANTFTQKTLFNTGVNLAQASEPGAPVPGDAWYSATGNSFRGLVQMASVANASNATPIVITTNSTHTLNTGDVVYISGIAGNTAANGSFTITVTDATHFSLNASAGNGAYGGGGSVSIIQNLITDRTFVTPYPALFHGSKAPVCVISNGNGTGTLTVNNGSATVTFSVSQNGILANGSQIITNGGQSRIITSGSGTTWTTDSAFSSNEAAVAFKYQNCNTLTIAAIHERDKTNSVNIDTTTPLTVDLRTTGLNGLDAGGVTGNTWYYAYAVTNGSSTGILLSTVNEFISGSVSSAIFSYTQKRQLPFAIRTNAGGGIIPFFIGNGWPVRPLIQYGIAFSEYDTPITAITNVLNGGTATTFTTVSLGSFVPEIARVALLKINNYAYRCWVRKSSDISTGAQLGTSYSSSGLESPPILVETNTSQQVDYKSSSGSNGVYLDVAGFIVTEV